jgi:hypothetical protein
VIVADVTVFRAPRERRAIALVGIVLLVVLAGLVLARWGFSFTIGAILAVLIIGNLWWSVLRPRLTADDDGIEIVQGRQPRRVAWRDIQRTEVSPKGTLIVVRGGEEILSRVPFGVRSTSSGAQTEADRVAIFLAARTTWARRRDGTPPPSF